MELKEDISLLRFVVVVDGEAVRAVDGYSQVQFTYYYWSVLSFIEEIAPGAFDDS
jgi:hypothetical protein